MKNRVVVSAAVLLVSAVCLYFILQETGNPRQDSIYTPREKTTRSSKDDPEARARYQWLRLRNPLTNEIPRDIRSRELAFVRTLPTRESLVDIKGADRLSGAEVLTWNPRGPFNVGGRTRALAIDVSNESIVLAGGVSGGLYRSTDGGATWTNTTGAAQLHSITSIVQDRRAGKTNVWYYTTGEFTGSSPSGGNASFRGDGIFKSTDNGVSWTQLPSTVSGTPHSFDQPFDFCWNIATDPSNTAQDEVYAATFGGIRRSTDGGSSWATVLGGFSNSVSQFTDVAVTSGGVVYATLSQRANDGSSSAARGIWRSTDGVTWVNITPSAWPLTYNRVVMAIAPSNENQLYFMAATPGSGTNGVSFWSYTYMSGDGTGSGGNWENRSANLPALGDPVGDLDLQNSYNMIVRVKPDNPNVVFIGGTNLYRSTDAFATSTNWTWIGGYNTTNDVSQYPNHHPDLHSQVFLASNPNVAISGHDGGLSKTTNIMADSVIWSSLNTGYVTSQFYSVAIDPATAGNDIIVGGLQDNGTYFTNSAAANNPWLAIGSGDGSYAAIADGRSAYFTSVQNGKIFREIRNDAGTLSIWTRVDPQGGSGYLFINPFVIDPNDNNILYVAGGDRIWRNDDVSIIPAFSNDPATAGWTQLTNSVVGSGTISALGISRSPANVLYYGTTTGRVLRLNNANSGNPMPTDIATGKGLPSNAYVSCIAVDPIDAENVLLVFSNYGVKSLFYTEDGGNTWSDVSGNLEQNADGSGNGPSTRWASILPTNSGPNYFVATSTGVFSTMKMNGGATVWAQEGASSIGNVVVDMIVTRAADGLVVVATHGAGVYSATVSGTEFLFPASNLSAQVANNDVMLQWTSPEGSSPPGGDVELLFDDGSFESFLGFTSGSGELLNGPFVAPAYPATLKSISFLTSGSRVGDNVAIHIYEDGDGSATNPTGLPSIGTISPVQIGPGGVFQSVDLSPLNITLTNGGTFFVSVEQLVPNQNMAIGLDTDAPDGNAFFGGNGSFSSISGSGFNGVFAIRAVVATSGTGGAGREPVLTEVTAGVFSDDNQLATHPSAEKMTAGFSSSAADARTGVLLSAPTATLQSFNVYRSTSPGAAANGTLIATTGASVTTYSDQNLADGTYYYQVTALYDAGESIPSNEEQAVVSVVSVADNDPQVPKVFSLSQNFPNPFNPATLIRYALPLSHGNGNVRVDIFNSLGQRVRSLVDRRQTAGNYVATWDGTDDFGRSVASGLYVYRIRAGAFTESRKMLLLK